MRGLSRLAARNWRASPGRCIAVVLSVALGVATVVLLTSFYETARRVVADEVAARWVGTAHVSIDPPGAHWGSLEASFADTVRRLPNVSGVTARLHRRAFLTWRSRSEHLLPSGGLQFDVVGIDPEHEAPFRSIPLLRGRLLGESDRGAVLIEEQTAADWRVDVGDPVEIAPYFSSETREYRVVGVFAGRRLAEFQKPIVYMPIADAQELFGQPGGATVIDVRLADASPAAVVAARGRLQSLLAERDLPWKVVSAEGRQRVIEEAESVTRAILVLTACISMLTSFFIILTTMGVALVQRRVSLGILRCLGMTRGQMSWLVLLELIPLGVLGTVLGLAGGVWIAHLIVSHPDVHISRLYFSTWGMVLAGVSGIATTVVSCAFLLFQVSRVTPLASVNTEARGARTGAALLAGAVGVALLVVYEILWRAAGTEQWSRLTYAAAVLVAGYAGYMLLAPALVVLVGGPMARIIGPILGLNGRLARDQFGKTPWRSAGVCWMLLVGVSLIVYTAVRAEGIYSAWAFHAHLPEAFVYARRLVPAELIERVRDTPGVQGVSAVADVDCEIVTRREIPRTSNETLLDSLLKNLTRPVYVAGDIDELVDMVKVGFAEGTRTDAIAKLKLGGHVLIPTQTAQSEDLHLGDVVRLRIGQREADFTIAGVVQSPSMDIAVTFFQAESYLQFAAAQALLGTREDLRTHFGIDAVSMFLCELEHPVEPPPGDFAAEDLAEYQNQRAVVEAILSWTEHLPNQRDRLAPLHPALEQWMREGGDLPEEASVAVRQFALSLRDVSWRRDERTREENWNVFQERLLLHRLAETIRVPDAVIGSVTRLKQAVERNVREAIVLVTWMPSISLVVAAIGVGNLMMVSVHTRARELAVLRAVGAYRGQVLRLVLTEAVTLGVLGSVLGVVMGIHQGYSVNQVGGRITGVFADFVLPATPIVGACVLTVSVCVLAALIPARYAARSSIVSALQTT